MENSNLGNQDRNVEVLIYCDTAVLSIRAAKIIDGKFYQPGDKNREIPASEIDTIKISAGFRAQICATGRKAAWYGAEGSFDIFEEETKLGNYYFKCPYVGSNQSIWTPVQNIPFSVNFIAGNLTAKELGTVHLEFYKD